MKKTLLLILVVAIIFSAAACGQSGRNTDDTTTVTTTENTDTETNESSETDSETATKTDSETETESDTETESNSTSTEDDESSSSEPVETVDEIDTAEAEEIEFGFVTSGDKTAAFISRRTDSIEVVLTLDDESYDASYLSYSWILDFTGPGGTTRVELGDHVAFVADEANGIVNAYFGIQEAGYVPALSEDYTITVYALEDSDCVYYGTVEVTAKIGENEDGEIIKQGILLAWTVNNPPYENKHMGAPHAGRVVLVFRNKDLFPSGVDSTKFSLSNILTNFDVNLYVDGEKHQVTEFSSWSQGLRFGVEEAGFAPTAIGQENEIRVEFCTKGTNIVEYEIDKITVTSNLPIALTKDANRAEGDDKQYSSSKITVTGPEGFEYQGIEYAFDGKSHTKYCVSKDNILSGPVVITTQESIKLSSISFATADDNASQNGRVPTGFKIEGSNDGETWTEIYIIAENPFPSIANYTEYNFAIETAKQASYNQYKITFTATSTVQFSEIMLFVA